jgi:hypothetical protein
VKTYIIVNLDTIKAITGKDLYKKIILHLNTKKRVAKYESDYTSYELTERADYDKVLKIIEEQ